MFRKIIKIILVFLCMLTIFMFSSDNGTKSSEKSDNLIVNTIEIFKNKKLNKISKKKYIKKYVFIVRKTAHFTIYLILGLLIISLLKEYMIISSKTFFLAIILVFLYACTDEFHQNFVPGRDAKVFDVIIDTLGGSVGTFIYYFFRRKSWIRKSN